MQKPVTSKNSKCDMNLEMGDVKGDHRSLHPATQYAMRHSDVQMTSFGTDHNSGSWLWSGIPFLSLSSFDAG